MDALRAGIGFLLQKRGLPYQRLSSAASDSENDSGILATDSGMMLATHSGRSEKVANIASEQMANFTSEWVANFDWNRWPTCPGIRRFKIHKLLCHWR